MKYKIKLYEIEAIKFVGSNYKEIEDFCGFSHFGASYFYGNNCVKVTINNANGCTDVAIGDYVVKEIDGNFYVYNSDEFEKKYESIN